MSSVAAKAERQGRALRSTGHRTLIKLVENIGTHLGRWIVFHGRPPHGFAVGDLCRFGDGGPWIPVTDGTHWDEKHRWSPDGKIIYFVSARSGFYNVFGVHFDL
jgi:WD40-like Beta Propeller Repeat